MTAHTNCVLFEINEQRCQFLSQRLDDALVIHASGTDLEALRSEGIEHADVFISLTDSDEVNVVSCMLANSLGAKHTVALIKQPDCIPMLLDQPSINTAFSPRQLTARHILRFTRSRGRKLSAHFPR